MLYIPQALSTNFKLFLAVRFFVSADPAKRSFADCQQGASSSVGNSMVSGTVADIFGPDDRGRPMSLFTWATFLGQFIGGGVFGWVVQELDFQWVYGVSPCQSV